MPDRHGMKKMPCGSHTVTAFASPVKQHFWRCTDFWRKGWGKSSVVFIYCFFPLHLRWWFFSFGLHAGEPWTGRLGRYNHACIWFRCDVRFGLLNHVSADHQWFKNYLAGKVPGKSYFIEPDPGFDYSKVIRPRSTPWFNRFWNSGRLSRSLDNLQCGPGWSEFFNPDVLIEMIRDCCFISAKVYASFVSTPLAFCEDKGNFLSAPTRTHQIVKLLRDIVTFVSRAHWSSPKPMF